MSESTESGGVAVDSRRWWALGAMCGALFMIMLDNTAVNVALPSIQRSLHATTMTLQWVVNSYTLTLAVMLVTGGRLADIFGRKRIFLIGVAIFTLASAGVGLAPTATWALIGRIAQGLGAALLMPATLAIVTDLFPAEERGKAIGIWTGVSGMALAIGPLVGGLLVESVGWRAIFFVNVPVAVAAAAVTVVAVRESRNEESNRVDVPGLLALTIGLTALMMAMVKINTWHLGSARVIGLFALGAVSLASFVAIELRSGKAMVNLKLFRSRTFVGAVLVTFISGFILFGVMFFMSIYIQNILVYSPLQTGLRFLPAMGALIVVSVVSGLLSDRIGARPLVAAGMLAMGGAAYWASTVTVHTGYPKLLGGILLLGCGVGLSLPPTSTAALNSVKQAEAGVAAGILAMSRMVGGAIGICSLGAIMINATTSKLDQLMPFLPPGASTQMANTPPSPKALELAPTELLEKGREAFVYGLQVTMRYGAILPVVGALLAALLIARRQAGLAGLAGMASMAGEGESAQASQMPALSGAGELDR